MTTSNVLVTTTAWAKVADVTDSDFLITWSESRTLEVATTEFDSPPDIRGHRFPREAQITREIVGAGHVWVRGINTGSGTSFIITLTKTESIAGAVGGYDSYEQVHKVAILKWNPVSLSWERDTTTGDGGGSSGTTPVTKRIETLSSYIYVGEAPIGTLDSSPLWMIKRIQLNASGLATSIKWAGGSWDNSAALTYQ